jgi:hypothetical protein
MKYHGHWLTATRKQRVGGRWMVQKKRWQCGIVLSLTDASLIKVEGVSVDVTIRNLQKKANFTASQTMQKR